MSGGYPISTHLASFSAKYCSNVIIDFSTSTGKSTGISVGTSVGIAVGVNVGGIFVGIIVDVGEGVLVGGTSVGEGVLVNIINSGSLLFLPQAVATKPTTARGAIRRN